MKCVRIVLGGLLVGLATVALTGCASRSMGDQRLTRYRPDTSQRQPMEWVHLPARAAAVPDARDNADAAAAAAATPTPVAQPIDSYSGIGEVLRRGDGITLYLRNIPRPEDIREEVDAGGDVTLPLIGTINVAGMTTSQAEDAIKTAYIDGGFYRKIDVIMVAEAGSYYVRGEVKRPGNFQLSGDVTLIQAITTAGGYTDFARRSKIKVIRGQQDMVFDVDRIEDGKEQDPLIKANDTIIVPRRWM